MQATNVTSSISVIQTYPEFGELIVNCQSYEIYKSLSAAIIFCGEKYGLTGWNSDKGIACYRKGITVAYCR